MLNISVIMPFFNRRMQKKIKFFKKPLNNKNSISFSHIKFLLSLFFSQKMMEFWSFFLSCFWGPQNLLGPSKKTQLLDSWPLGMPQKTRPWAGLVWKKCPVSSYHGTALLQNQPKKLVNLVCNTLLVGLFYVSPIQKQ